LTKDSFPFSECRSIVGGGCGGVFFLSRDPGGTGIYRGRLLPLGSVPTGHSPEAGPTGAIPRCGSSSKASGESVVVVIVVVVQKRGQLVVVVRGEMLFSGGVCYRVPVHYLGKPGRGLVGGLMQSTELALTHIYGGVSIAIKIGALLITAVVQQRWGRPLVVVGQIMLGHYTAGSETGWVMVLSIV